MTARPPAPYELAGTLADMTPVDAEAQIVAAQGVCATIRAPDQW